MSVHKKIDTSKFQLMYNTYLYDQNRRSIFNVFCTGLKKKTSWYRRRYSRPIRVKYNSFEVMVLHIKLSREKSINDKSPVMFVLATVYRPPGHHTDFIKEFADFLSELVLAADRVLIVGDFNIHVDNEKDALGSAFIDILNSIGVRQHASGPTHSRNHTLDLIPSHGIDVNGVEILQQSDDISDHYLVLCKLHIVKVVNSTPPYKFGRTITSTTKDCFVSNLPDLSQFLSISNSSEQLDVVTETMNSLFSSTLDTVAPLRLRKIVQHRGIMSTLAL